MGQSVLLPTSAAPLSNPNRTGPRSIRKTVGAPNAHVANCGVPPTDLFSGHKALEISHKTTNIQPSSATMARVPRHFQVHPEILERKCHKGSTPTSSPSYRCLRPNVTAVAAAISIHPTSSASTPSTPVVSFLLNSLHWVLAWVDLCPQRKTPVWVGSRSPPPISPKLRPTRATNGN